MEEEKLISDPLFLGITRPPMVAGVTFSFFIINLLSTVIGFLALNSFLAFLVGLPIHVIGYLFCLKDPRFFDLYLIKFTKAMPIKNKQFWRSNSYLP
jgi:type IV secretion system protein VirB3